MGLQSLLEEEPTPTKSVKAADRRAAKRFGKMEDPEERPRGGRFLRGGARFLRGAGEFFSTIQPPPSGAFGTYPASLSGFGEPSPRRRAKRRRRETVEFGGERFFVFIPASGPQRGRRVILTDQGRVVVPEHARRRRRRRSSADEFAPIF